jgi:hypothetical protein
MEPRDRLSRAREGLIAIKLQKLEAKEKNKKGMHAMMCYTAMYYPCDQSHSLHETNIRVNRCMYYFCMKTKHQSSTSSFHIQICSNILFITMLVDMIRI